MDMYINALPKEILDDVAQNFNCEDIAMSFLISSKTQGKPSLLADVWALKTMIKLYVQKKISGTKSHKSLRDNCVDTYAKILGIKKEPKKLQMVQYLPTSGELFFDCGDEPSSDGVHHMKSKREKNLERMMSDLKQLNLSKKANRINGLVQVAGLGAYKQGKIRHMIYFIKRCEIQKLVVCTKPYFIANRSDRKYAKVERSVWLEEIESSYNTY
jgi:hypothetical protein